MKVHSMLIADNGHYSCFDENGKVIEGIDCKPWLSLIFDHLEQQGVDVRTIVSIDLYRQGHPTIVRPFRTIDGEWNYELKSK
jgi:hypothetical protein